MKHLFIGRGKAMNGKKLAVIISSFFAVVIISVATVFIVKGNKKDKKLAPGTDMSTGEINISTEQGETTEDTGDKPEPQNIDKMNVAYFVRPQILDETEEGESITPSVPAYTIEADLSNVYNNESIAYFSDEQKNMLVNNGFVVVPGGGLEFFEKYENNRYNYDANFITVDSMMHTYHLYFAYLLRTTEKEHLSNDLSVLSGQMMEETKSQYEKLKGTEWEEAARTNLAFFAVGGKLLDDNAEVPSEVADVVSAELELINAADSIADSPLFSTSELPVLEDYSQYKPRGYYEGDEQLERYFRAMMWYGRRNFAQADDTQNRSALLMTLALSEDAIANWEKIYTVTSFFAGASDDSGYYEYRPIIEAAYGSDVTVDDLAGNDVAWDNFKTLTDELPAPKINSVPVYASDTDEEVENKIVGYRFMGQRFSIDEAIFTQLVYRNVLENSNGEVRMLPNGLDVPAALGSDTALSILEANGDTGYEKYSEHMDMLRTDIANAPENTWNSCLYSGWINTLRPLLDKKGEGYPMFMQNEEWNKKNLVTFLGSYAELKHDTVLYSKQMIAEMGGAEIPILDDRGYVEPEVEVYRRLSSLVKSTSQGLERYGYLTQESKEDLSILADLSNQLATISEKELRNELPTDEEFELIKTFGGQLEHFWQETTKDQAGTDYFTTDEFPASIIVDIATDPNGSCLEVGTGRVNTIYVVVPVDGQLKIASGPVYSYYEFSQPLSDRLTDTEWRIMLGIELDENGSYNWDNDISMPSWTDSFVKKNSWDY